MSAAGPLVPADALPARAKDTPATPNIGTAFLARFRFEVCFVCDIVEFLRANIPKNSFATAPPLCALLNAPETNFGARDMKFSCLLVRVCSVENWLIFGLIAGVRPPDIIELSLCSPVNCCGAARNSSGVTGTRRSPPSLHRLNLWSGPAQDAMRTIPILAVAYDLPWQQACPHNLLPLDHFTGGFSRQFYSSTLKAEHKIEYN
jgi:hypothetical protein